jgi:hypothetical protein
MDGNVGLIVFYIVFGFFALVLLTSTIVMLILWNRRKLTFTNFLGDTGKWERASWKEKEFSENSKHKLQTFEYKGTTYNFDIKKVTRDTINRPIAHYHKGNPNQLEFDYTNSNKPIKINNQELTPKDFITLMTSKVLRDIFQDEEVMQMLWIILIVVGIGAIAGVIVTLTHNPPCTLKVDDNETLQVIAQGVRMGLLKK